MERNLTKPPKIAICQRCKGTGRIKTGDYSTFPTFGACPRCEGSGRVTVSCRMTLDIRAYRPGNND